MGIWILIFIVGGLLFIYFNLLVWCKVNITITFVNIFVLVIFFKKKYQLSKRILYFEFANKLIARYKRTKSVDKVKSHFDYLKYVKYVKRLPRIFIIKNIHLYPEHIEEFSTFAIEFIVVNNVLKKSLLNE